MDDGDVLYNIINQKFLRQKKRELILEVLESASVDSATLTVQQINSIEKKWNKRIKNNPHDVIVRLDEYIEQHQDTEESIKDIVIAAAIAEELINRVYSVYCFLNTNFDSNTPDLFVNMVDELGVRESIMYRVLASESIFVTNDGDNLENKDWYYSYKNLACDIEQISYFTKLMDDLPMELNGFAHGFVLYYLLIKNWGKAEKAVNGVDSIYKQGKQVVLNLFDVVGYERMTHVVLGPITWREKPRDNSLLAILIYLYPQLMRVYWCFHPLEYENVLIGKEEESYLWIEEGDEINPLENKVHRIWQMTRRMNNYCLIKIEFGEKTSYECYFLLFNKMYFLNIPGVVAMSAIFWMNFLENKNLDEAVTQVYIGAYVFEEDVIEIARFEHIPYDDTAIFEDKEYRLKRVNLDSPLPNEKAFVSIYNSKKINDLDKFIEEVKQKKGYK